MIAIARAGDESATRPAFGAAGLSAAGAARAAARLVRVVAGLAARGHDRVRAWWVPGRIEVLGKHTDYAGGESLVAAIEQGFVFAGAARPDGGITLSNAANEETLSIGERADGPPWRRYPEAALARLSRDCPPASSAPGFDLAFDSDLPAAAGLSSSTALIAGTVLATVAFRALDETAAWRMAIPGHTELAAYLGAVESGAPYGAFTGDAGVGTEGGAQDSTAILCAAPDAISHFRYAPTRPLGAVPLAPDLAFVVGASGVVAEKTGDARARYNRASRLAAEAAAWVAGSTGEAVPHLGAAVKRLGTDGVRRALDAAPAVLRERAEHFLAESVRHVPALRHAFVTGSARKLGDVVDASVRGAARWLRNQVPETMALAAKARTLGAIAASPFGAGYGGSVWALVARDDVATFSRAWRDAYVAAFPQHRSAAAFFRTEAGPAAFEVTLA